MHLLFKHVDYIFWKAKKKAIENGEELTEKNKERTVENALLVYLAIEKGDKDNVEKAVEEITDVAEKIGVGHVVLFPFIHLFIHAPASPHIAMELLDAIERKLEREVYRVPFGWYKEYEYRSKGHPLSTLSRRIQCS
ncbi:MAG: threonyl-tRNA synthetase editing domain-containing protein [Euryarchaeota archaeon]|nr:threonyl-tRNA synthetase editing domain-containing protein [Euryarchaeota archaeon]